LIIALLLVVMSLSMMAAVDDYRKGVPAKVILRSLAGALLTFIVLLLIAL